MAAQFPPAPRTRAATARQRDPAVGERREKLGKICLLTPSAKSGRVGPAMNGSKNQFSFTRAAPNRRGRQKPNSYQLKQGFVRLLLVTSLVPLVGCAVCKITKFEVKPPVVCAGEPVTISWETVSDPVEVDITTDPQVDPPLGKVDARGEAVRHVKQTTTFTLVMKCAPTSLTNQQVVTVVPPAGLDVTLGAPGRCPGPVWQVAPGPTDYSGSLVVNTVWNNSDPPRNIVVTHENKTIPIPPGQTVPFFAGTHLDGLWILRPDPLMPDELAACPPGVTADNPQLPILQISVNAKCP